MAISIDTIPNRKSPPAILCRYAWREGKHIRRRTLANRSKMPPDLVNGLRALIKGGVIVDDIKEALIIERTLPHGNALAVLETARKLGLDKIRARKKGRMRQSALASCADAHFSPGVKTRHRQTFIGKNRLCQPSCHAVSWGGQWKWNAGDA